jgi:ATP-dependent clp protease ATP-binding subunit clpX
MKNIEIAILFKKEICDGQKGLYYFKPCFAVEGITDQQNNTFLDETNVERPFLGVSSLETDFYIGSVANSETIKKLFPNANNIEQAKKLLLNSVNEQTFFGILCKDKENKEKIKILTLDLKSTEKMIDQTSEILNQRNLKDPNYLNLKSRLKIENFDFTVFNDEDIKQLLEMEDLEEVRKILTSKMIHKDAYQQGEERIIIINDEEMIQLILENNLDHLKSYLTDLFQLDSDQVETIKEDDEIENATITFEEFCRYANNQIITSNSVEDAHYYLNIVSDTTENLLSELDSYGLTDQEYGLCARTIDMMIQKVQSILHYNNTLEDIVYNYKNMYQDMTNLVKQVNQILCSKKSFIMLEEIEPEEELETNSKMEDTIEQEISFNYNECYQYLVSHVIGRGKQIGSILSMIDCVDHNTNRDKKTCGIIAGPTGTGKTQTFTSLRRAMPNRPITITDTNQLTSAGYTGGTIEGNILGDLLRRAHEIHKNIHPEYSNRITKEDVLLAERGIVFLDEIDKRKSHESSTPDVNGSGVIDALLKMMDGTTYQVAIDHQTILFDTSKLVIFAGGAFQEYFDFSEKTIGYQSKSKQDQFEKYLEVNPEDLVEYGLSSQFVGRCGCVCLYPRHTSETLLTLEQNKKTSFLQNREEVFHQKEIALVWDNDFLSAYIEKAIELKEGARGLSHILDRCTNDAYTEICRFPERYKAVYLSKESLYHPEQVLLLTTDNECVRMDTILKRNQVEYQQLYDMNSIECDSTYLEFFQKEKVKTLKP